MATRTLTPPSSRSAPSRGRYSGSGNGGNGAVAAEAQRRGPVAIELSPEVQTSFGLDIRSFGPQHRFPNRLMRGLGWLRDLPDFRDATLVAPAPKFKGDAHKPMREAHARAASAISKTGARKAAAPASIDHRAFCSPIEDQGNLGSCTSQACAGMVEYMERRASGRHIDASRLFIYKTTRKLLGWTGDTGAFLRTTMQAIALFGAPPEEWWPHSIPSFDDEPDSFLYAYASNYQALQYMRLDPAGTAAAQVLQNVKAALATNYVSMFGFTVYDSLSWSADIPFPSSTDSVSGGHAVLAVGYDDSHQCPNASPGALLIRNSWGTDWGDQGYGWLPYDYVLTGLADDFWTCLKQEWIDSGQFQ